jgi:flagellar basal-body rod protein FlgB|tara:strand:- start:5522 stop:5929 length:408 start_codon:yes stop_codon:yes gene_type:complete
MVDKFGIFDVFGKRLEWLNQRQTVIAQNIANADTPNYQPRDLKRGSFQEVLKQSASQNVVTRATQPNHLTGSLDSRSDIRSQEVKSKYEVSPTGNAVVLEEQLVNLSKTQLEHTTVTNLYGKYVGLFKMALRGNG